MKTKLLFLLFLLFQIHFISAQKAEVVTIKLNAFEKAGKLTDILKDISTDCVIKSYVFSIVVKGSEKTITINNQELNEIRGIVLSMKTKQFFIEKIQSNCKPKPKNRYKVVLED